VTASSIPSIVATVVFVALVVFFALMWVRFVFDWVRVVRPRWRPQGAALLLAESSYAVTDPPVRLARRLVPPIRLEGGVQLELSWSIVMLACLVLMWIAGAII
jgi:YggT family protein